MSKGITGAVLACVLTLALVGGGCGGGDQTTALTRQQFTKQANGICKVQRDKRNAEVAAAVKGQNQSKLLPLKQREDLVLEILRDYEVAYEKISALAAPEGDENRVNAIIEAMEESAQKIKADPAEALVSTKQFSNANKLSAEYGLTECVV